MIKAVIFDIDGVLLDSFEANLKFFQDLMIKTGYQPPTREEYLKIFHFTMMDAIKYLVPSGSEEEVNRLWTMGKNRAVPYPTELLIMPDNALKTIKKLNKFYLLGIVTSRIREAIYGSSPLSKLEKYFQTVISFQDTINHKPHPEPLVLAAARLGVRPNECAYIGDVANDIEAARAAGMKVIIYSKNNFPEADACTSSFDQLSELIATL